MLFRSLIYVLLALPIFWLGGCTIAEQIEVEVIYAPQLQTKFQIDQAPVVIRDGRVFIYDDAELLICDTLLDASQMSSAEPLLLIKGVAAGHYSMITYYNVDKMGVEGNQVGKSTKDDLEIKLPVNRSDDNQIDSLCHSTEQFNLQRGIPTYTTTQIETVHYFVHVRITGLDRPTVPLGEIGVKLLDIPQSLNAHKVVCQRKDLDLALRPVSAAESVGDCMTLKFSSKDRARLRVCEAGVSIQTLPLEPERYFAAQTPSNHLYIDLQFYANSYVISVNDWKLGEFELINMGG